MARVTLTRDDLTGVEIPEAGKPVTVTFNGAKHELDLSDISVKALSALLSGNGTGLNDFLAVYQDAGLRLAPEPAPAKSGRKRSASASAGKDGGRNARARSWGLDTADGRKAARAAYPDRPDTSPLPERGRVSPDFLAAFDAWEAKHGQHGQTAPAASTASPAPAATG